LKETLDIFARNKVVERIEKALQTAWKTLGENGNFPFPETLQVGIFVSNGKNIVHEKINHGFSGFGGIPGFIVLILSPTDYVLKSIEALVAHEFHHNVRNAIEPWPKDNNISVGQYLLIEGLAEAFTAELYGEEAIGPQTIGLRGVDLEKAKRSFLLMRIKIFSKNHAFCQIHYPLFISIEAWSSMNHFSILSPKARSRNSIIIINITISRKFHGKN